MTAPQLAAALRTLPPTVARRAALVGNATLLAMGAILTVRRATGALTDDLGVAPLTATLLAAAAIVLGGRAVWRHAGVVGAPRAEHAFAWSGTAAIFLLSIGCAWPSTASLAWVLALPLLAGDHFSRVAFLDESRTSPAVAKQITAPTNEDAQKTDLADLPKSESLDNGEQPDEQPVQSLTRTRDAAGVESIRGLLHAQFDAGQRHATLHVGFCPPLARLPVVEVEVADGPDAAIKVVQAFAHGARLELRLSEPAEEPCEVVVEFVATPG